MLLPIVSERWAGPSGGVRGFVLFVLKGVLFCLKGVRAFPKTPTPCCKFSAKMSFLLLKVKSNSDMHSAICKGALL